MDSFFYSLLHKFHCTALIRGTLEPGLNRTLKLEMLNQLKRWGNTLQSQVVQGLLRLWFMLGSELPQGRWEVIIAAFADFPKVYRGSASQSWATNPLADRWGAHLTALSHLQIKLQPNSS